jgi:aminoglycoside phosphotransferase (APT) family kinase protein
MDAPRPKMHEDEIDVGLDLVRGLVERQLPEHAGSPLARVASQGTVNAIYRLGDDLVVRLPLTPKWHDIEAEACWLASLAPHVPVLIPEVVAIGEPDETYPWPWGVFRWIDGAPWSIDSVADPVDAALTIAETVRVLGSIDPRSLPCGKPLRRPPLESFDEQIRAAADGARHLLDGDAFLAAWDDALAVPPFDGEPLLCHGDLLAGNVLVHRGRLCAVIDWAGVCRADPARELMAAWMLFAGESRAAFRAHLDVDEDTWRRAKGWVLTRIFGVAYYETTNPVFSLDARRAIAEVLADR